MPSRQPSPPRSLSISVDLVLIARVDRELEICLVGPAGAGRGDWRLPSRSAHPDETLDESARSIATNVLGRDPNLIRQARAAVTRAPAGRPTLSVVYFALTDRETRPDPNPPTAWVPLARLPRLPAPQAEAIEIALSEMRRRVDEDPVAFALLPAQFTLSELQLVYELLLGHRLHKASFRRALLAAELVQPTEEWRSEARGRPAQLFRYAPKRKRRSRRALRFDLLGN